VGLYQNESLAFYKLKPSEKFLAAEQVKSP
jgi:hypothetical protein